MTTAVRRGEHVDGEERQKHRAVRADLIAGGKPRLYAYPPGQAQRQSTGITQGFCPKAAPAGDDSMHPLAGVPFYTTR